MAGGGYRRPGGGGGTLSADGAGRSGERRWLARPAVRAWLLVAACVALIWTASGEDFSAERSSRFLGPLLRWLFDADNATIRSVHFAARKAAHVVEYALLALLSYRALCLSVRTTLLRHALVALILVAAVAASDEARQAFEPSRTGSPWDVALDLAGGFGALLTVALLRDRPRMQRWFPSAPVPER